MYRKVTDIESSEFMKKKSQNTQAVHIPPPKKKDLRKALSISFGTESFVFQFAIQKVKDQDI